MITTDLGSVTAYAEAVAQGYTGTKEEFGKLLANYTQTAEKVAEDKAAAEQAMESAKESADRASASEQNAKASEDAVLQKLAEAKTEVDASVEAGKKSKTDLNKSIADSAKAKTALDESIKSANGSKSALDKTVEQANVLDASLSSNIVDGTQLNKDITASGNKAVSDINSASAKALEDINTTGTAKLDAVNKAAEAIVADREQIATNKEDIGSLKEDISNKITKFYASNQGETHITDSDNGKIQDMMIYGKSSQDGTPTPENPVEIKSVVNPTVKIVGKNLLKATLQTTTKNGVTCTVNGDGSYTLNGTATSRAEFWAIGGYTNNVKIPLNPTKKYVLKGTGYSRVQLHVGTADHTIVSGDGKGIILTNMAGVAFVLIRVESGFTADNLTIYLQLEEGSTSTTYEPYHEQTVTLPYTLNAIPVSSGGNVVIDGQQYIADYVDIEKGVLVRCVLRKVIRNATGYGLIGNNNLFYFDIREYASANNGYCNYYIADGDLQDKHIRFDGPRVYIKDDSITSLSEFNSKYENGLEVVYIHRPYTETNLTTEQAQALKELVTYYPVTNISVNSEQLDGYTVFNYPISMAEGWNYVKQQIGDTRDYIYDMDLQSAEAYVNSEYAVALTELEV